MKRLKISEVWRALLMAGILKGIMDHGVNYEPPTGTKLSRLFKIVRDNKIYIFDEPGKRDTLNIKAMIQLYVWRHLHDKSDWSGIMLEECGDDWIDGNGVIKEPSKFAHTIHGNRKRYICLLPIPPFGQWVDSIVLKETKKVNGIQKYITQYFEEAEEEQKEYEEDSPGKNKTLETPPKKRRRVSSPSEPETVDSTKSEKQTPTRQQPRRGAKNKSPTNPMSRISRSYSCHKRLSWRKTACGLCRNSSTDIGARGLCILLLGSDLLPFRRLRLAPRSPPSLR